LADGPARAARQKKGPVVAVLHLANPANIVALRTARALGIALVMEFDGDFKIIVRGATR